MKRRQEKKLGYTREDFISNLDKPRHDERVTNVGYSDESLIEDLNEKVDYSVSNDDNDEPIVIDTNIEDIK